MSLVLTDFKNNNTLLEEANMLIVWSTQMRTKVVHQANICQALYHVEIHWVPEYKGEALVVPYQLTENMMKLALNYKI